MISATELHQRFIHLTPAIRKAGQHVTHMRKMGQAHVSYKEDDSPVTSADIWANGFLREQIEALFPGETIVGEEDEIKNYQAGTPLVWYVDPIDGTSSFVNGGTDYYVLAGLTYEGQPVFGMHYRPETDTMIFGWQGFGAAFMKGEGEAEKLKPKMPEWGTNSRVFIKSHNAELREKVKNLGITRAKFLPGMVDMVGPLFGLSEGFISYRRTAYWDLAAPAAIMSAAGFRHPGETFNGGEPLLFNDGGWKTTFFYSLPPNTPDAFIESLIEIKKQFAETDG